MKRYKKLYASLLVLGMVGTILSGCNSKEEPPIPGLETTAPEEASPSPEASPSEVGTSLGLGDVVADSLLEEPGNLDENSEEGVIGTQDPTVSQETYFVIVDGLELAKGAPMDEQMFKDTYGIDPDILISYYVHMPMMNVQATEVAVFEVKNEVDVDLVVEGIHKRQQALEAQWQSYLPDQYELVKNYKVEVRGKMVLFVISEEANQIVNQFGNIN